MELTKEQIKKIDTRLKIKGIKYWDLRVEMVDHIVSDIEENATTNDFKIELEKSLKKLGWQESLRKENQEGWKNVNTKYRRKYYKEIIRFFKSFKNTLSFVLLAFLYYFISKQMNHYTFSKVSISLFLLLIIPFLLITTKQLLKSYGRSVNLDYGTFYFSFPFLIVNLPLQFIKESSENFQKLFFLIFIPLFYVITYTGYKVYKTAIIKVEKMKKELAL
ncbi:conserved membrane hypothetical protein [Tenacibaculum sediminilitoris]|uniref:hypothetical protein n=1 Tax=Tenacibaculum sediminilitoris TaxID=1820334 RepID=UPI003894095F